MISSASPSPASGTMSSPKLRPSASSAVHWYSSSAAAFLHVGDDHRGAEGAEDLLGREGAVLDVSHAQAPSARPRADLFLEPSADRARGGAVSGSGSAP